MWIQPKREWGKKRRWKISRTPYGNVAVQCCDKWIQMPNQMVHFIIHTSFKLKWNSLHFIAFECTYINSSTHSGRGRDHFRFKTLASQSFVVVVELVQFCPLISKFYAFAHITLKKALNSEQVHIANALETLFPNTFVVPVCCCWCRHHFVDIQMPLQLRFDWHFFLTSCNFIAHTKKLRYNFNIIAKTWRIFFARHFMFFIKWFFTKFQYNACLNINAHSIPT